MTAPVVAAALMFWACVFMVYFTAAGTTPMEFFFGRYESPPELGQWKEVGADPATALLREERYLLPGGSRGRHLVLQVRWRDPATRQVVRVEPERRISRRRVSSRG